MNNLAVTMQAYIKMSSHWKRTAHGMGPYALGLPSRIYLVNNN